MSEIHEAIIKRNNVISKVVFTIKKKKKKKKTQQHYYSVNLNNYNTADSMCPDKRRRLSWHRQRDRITEMLVVLKLKKIKKLW